MFELMSGLYARALVDDEDVRELQHKHKHTLERLDARGPKVPPRHCCNDMTRSSGQVVKQA